MRVCRSLHALSPAYLSAAKGQFALLDCHTYLPYLNNINDFTNSSSLFFKFFNMLQKIYLAALSILALTASSSAEGFYTKNSPVLQVDGSSYNKLVAKSNQVSVSWNVIFYQAES